MAKHCQTGKGMFLKQPFHVLRHMTMHELVDLKKQRAYAVEAGKPLTRLDGCALLHPLMLTVIKIRRIMQRKKLLRLNERADICSNAIFAVNHFCCLDVPSACEAIQSHGIILVGKQPLKPVDRAFSNLNGTIWVDRHGKESKLCARRAMMDVLQRGKDLIDFPEGTWNLSPNALHLPLYWGIIDIAKQTGKPIIPLCIEYTDGKTLTKFSSPITVSGDDGKQEKAEELSAAFSTLKWDIYEYLPLHHRADISPDEWKKAVQSVIDAYPKLDLAYERSVIRKIHSSPTEAIAHLNRLHPSRENGFLMRKLEGEI